MQVASLLSQAQQLHRAGRAAEAARCYEQVLALDGQNLVALANLGALALDAGRFDEAIHWLSRAVQFHPPFAEGHNGLGIAHTNRGELAQAVNAFERAAALEPQQPAFARNLANARAAVHTQRGLELAAVRDWREAALEYQTALDVAADYLPAWGNLGNARRELGELDLAEHCYRRVLSYDPRSAEAHYSLALIAKSRRDHALAATSCRAALAQRPDYVEAHYELAANLLRLNRLDEALATMRRALDLRPDYAEAHFGYGYALLLAGRWSEGWQEFEWRFKQPGMMNAPGPPRWSGESLAGRTIVLRGEQGLGDTLQFVRYAALVRELGAIVVVQCKAALARLVATCRGVDRVVSDADPLPECDYQIPLLSLPRIFGTTPANVPAGVPYFEPDAELVRHWSHELGARQGLRVGIAWQGNPQQAIDHYRSIPLEAFAPLTQLPGVTLYSLQSGPGSEQLATLRAGPTVDLTARLGDFHNTAAIVRNLDLVITCDSAPAHLAGALGVPVWVALGDVPDWRWLLHGDDTPWYPTMRLFRQHAPGDWRGVLKDIANQLRPIAARPRDVRAGTSID